MPQDWRTLEITGGVDAHCPRWRVKNLFEQYGTVASCWMPLPEHRQSGLCDEYGFVRFETSWAAEAAMRACEWGELRMDHHYMKVRWKEPKQRVDSGLSADELLARLEKNYGHSKGKIGEAAEKERAEKEKDKKDKKKSKDKKDKDKKEKHRKMPSPATEQAQPSDIAAVPPKRKSPEIEIQDLGVASQGKITKEQGDAEAPWFVSALDGTDGAFKSLIEGRADVNVANKRGISALHLCAKRGCAPLCDALIAAQADVNKLANNGYTPLLYAVESTSQDACASLLKARAMIDVKNSGGAAPLHIAALRDNDSILAALLGAKATVDVQDSNGSTALHIAAANDNEAMYKLLRSANASEAIRDRSGQTAPAIVKRRNEEKDRAERIRKRRLEQRGKQVVNLDSD